MDNGSNEGIDKARIQHFLKHLYRAGSKISERERSREELRKHISKLKTTKETPMFMAELKKLENKIFDVVEKEKSVLYSQQKESETIRQLKDRIAILEGELKLHHEIHDQRQKERISAEKDFKEQELLELRSLLRNLEKVYHKIKGKEKNKKKLALMKQRIDDVKKRIKGFI